MLIAITGLSIGFKMVFSGPFVRSSYMADQVSEAVTLLTHSNSALAVHPLATAAVCCCLFFRNSICTFWLRLR